MDEFDFKQELKRILAYYDYLLDTDGCKMSEVESATRILMENMRLQGTSKDFARFFGTTESTVRSVIARKLIKKPTRRVYYPFNDFLKIVPRNWLKDK